MSISGTWQTTAPNRSGRCTMLALTSRPPFDPPMTPSCLGVVMPRFTMSCATAWKSS